MINYIEVSLEIDPFTEDSAELIIALIEELPFESFITENPFLKCYIPQDKYSPANLKTILSSLDNNPQFKIKIGNNLIEGKNWNEVWECNFPPITVGGKCTVKATFHRGLPKTKYSVTIDPKMAFGTGHHQTTHLMIERMLNLKFRDKRVLDMGCGTGILAILAAKMGATRPVHAIDIDPVAVESAKENCIKNRIGGALAALTGDASLIQRERYDVILANINRNIILSDIDTYSNGLSSKGLLLLSGFYKEDIDTIKERAGECGLIEVHRSFFDNWAMVEFSKK